MKPAENVEIYSILVCVKYVHVGISFTGFLYLCGSKVQSERANVVFKFLHSFSMDRILGSGIRKKFCQQSKCRHT